MPADEIIAQRKMIVFEDCLLELFKVCNICLDQCSSKIKTVCGTMIMVESYCENNHVRTWYSHPMSKQIPWGNVLCCAALLFSGSSPAKAISLLAMSNVQQTYPIPAVNAGWGEKQNELMKIACGDNKVVLGGDAKCDSPGHNTQ